MKGRHLHIKQQMRLFRTLYKKKNHISAEIILYMWTIYLFDHAYSNFFVDLKCIATHFSSFEYL